MRILRAALAALPSTLATASSAVQAPSIVERLVIRESGWESVDIVLERRGRGRVTFSDQRPGQRNRSFVLTPERLDRLLEHLAPYRLEAVPRTRESIMQMMAGICPAGVPFVTDAGGVWINWVGEGFDVHYSADLGCDHERHAARNDDLRAVVQSFVVGR